MLGHDVLTFQEFIVREPLPLSVLHQAVFEFLRDRDDVAVFGAQAVNAYVGEPRMTQDIDLLSPHAATLAEALREYLSQRFHIAVRIREVAGAKGYRLYQVQKDGNRHLVDVRAVDALPPAQRIAQVLVVTPAELIASKVISFYHRRGKPKSGTDWRDLALLLLAFPDLKSMTSPVVERLHAASVDEKILASWQWLVDTEILPEDEEDGF